MALNAALEELIGTLPAEDQPVLRAQLEKHKVLGEGFLRQQDYDKFFNENKAKLDEYGRLKPWYDTEGKALVQKANDNVTYYEREKARADKAEADLAAATDTIAKNQNVEPDKLAEMVQAKLLATQGHLTKDVLAKLITEEATKLATAERETFLKQTFPASMNFQTEFLEVQLDYHDEFGKRLDRKVFSKFMQDNQLVSPREAFEKFTETDRKEREKAQLRTEIEKEVRGNNPPGSGVFPSAELGPVQMRRKMEADGKNAPKLGAAAAADALVAMGKY